MTTIVYILLGGIWGGDGWVTSRGMLGLGTQLQALPYTTVKSYSWRNWQKAQVDLTSIEVLPPLKLQYDAAFHENSVAAGPVLPKIVLIGYSGGGMMGMALANRLLPRQWIDLMVLYDPSPPGEIETLSNNGVRNAVCYHNTKPKMWWPGIGQLGGGKLVVSASYTGKHKQIDFAQWHLNVQNNKTLHAMTVAAVQALQVGRDPIAEIKNA